MWIILFLLAQEKITANSYEIYSICSIFIDEITFKSLKNNIPLPPASHAIICISSLENSLHAFQLSPG